MRQGEAWVPSRQAKTRPTPKEGPKSDSTRPPARPILAEMADPFLPMTFMAAVGAGIFVRLVAKEKYRRERHLQFRLDEQIRKINEEKELEKQKAEKARKEQAEQAKAAGQPTAAPIEQIATPIS